MGVHRQNQSTVIDELAKTRSEFDSKPVHHVLLVDSIHPAQGWCQSRVEPELELDELVTVREVRGDRPVENPDAVKASVLHQGAKLVGVPQREDRRHCRYAESGQGGLVHCLVKWMAIEVLPGAEHEPAMRVQDAVHFP